MKKGIIFKKKNTIADITCPPPFNCPLLCLMQNMAVRIRIKVTGMDKRQFDKSVLASSPRGNQPIFIMRNKQKVVTDKIFAATASFDVFGLVFWVSVVSMSMSLIHMKHKSKEKV